MARGRFKTLEKCHTCVQEVEDTEEENGSAVTSLLVSNMTKSDIEAINIGRKIEMKLIDAESCDEIRWCTSALGLVLVN